MAKKIIISKFPDENLQNEMLSYLNEMKPERTTSLMSLLDALKNGIAKARKSGVGWEKIAAYISEKTETKISPDALSQSYTTLEREAKNKGRSADEISYTQLRYRYNTAVKLLKMKGINESDIDDMIAEDKKIKQEKSKKKTEEKSKTEEQKEENQKNSTEQSDKQEETEGTKEEEQKSEHDAGHDNSGEKIREDKNLFN